MDCPKCGFALDGDPVECTRCGVVIAKFLRAHQESLESAVELPPLLQATHAAAVAPGNESAARSERITRAVALPLALLFACPDSCTHMASMRTAPGDPLTASHAKSSASGSATARAIRSLRAWR